MDCGGSTCSEMLGGEGNCRGAQGLWHAGKVQAHSSRAQHSPTEPQMLFSSDSEELETALYHTEEGLTRSFLIISQSHKTISSIFAVQRAQRAGVRGGYQWHLLDAVSMWVPTDTAGPSGQCWFSFELLVRRVMVSFLLFPGSE